jgi:hypothetical protein
MRSPKSEKTLILSARSGSESEASRARARDFHAKGVKITHHGEVPHPKLGVFLGKWGLALAML